MKITLGVVMMVVLVVSLVAVAANPAAAGKPDGCTTIQDGVLIYSAGHYLAGQPLQAGYDPYGYNYQAHMFSGYTCSAVITAMSTLGDMDSPRTRVTQMPTWRKTLQLKMSGVGLIAMSSL